MSRSIDINNRIELKRLLLTLDVNTMPLWGKMRPRQMVEHLVDQVQWTNGKKIATCDRPAEEAARARQLMIYTDTDIPKNIFLEDLPDDYLYADIETAINRLMTELDDFDEYFEQPGRIAIHGGFGPMNYNEWLIWHGKHFGHHLMQFGLI